MVNKRLLPVKGCLVKRVGEKEVGISQILRPHLSSFEVLVLYPGGDASKWISIEECRSGFADGVEVLEINKYKNKYEQEVGLVVARRRIGGRDQHLVEFIGSGSRRWIPFENLRYFRSVSARFEKGLFEADGGADRLRLRNLAYALINWHQNTGSLTHLNIDPLPHQIHLVHHILKSGNLNWLIADDVGLGKTVETGMLLSALRARGAVKRILLVCPAGLVRQWKDEFHEKFSLSEFLIYGQDFFITDNRDWKRYDHVIASLDLVKSKSHLEKLLKADLWDVVIFDEAHRLSRTQWGMRFDSSERYRLASQLRKKSKSLLLLSATPHQGREDKFKALLELLRPELKEKIEFLSMNPWILNQMVIRNHKADVTDAEGNFIFKGKKVNTVLVDAGDKEREFYKVLGAYLEKGYGASESVSDVQARAIGFVMTVYRKLAASSISAIERALHRRYERLKGSSLVIDPDEYLDENPFQGEWEESASGEGEEFFRDETKVLEQLLVMARKILRADSKIKAFTDGVVNQILDGNKNEKILIFTEYRATLEYLLGVLKGMYGENSVVVIHGGMSTFERRSAILSFDASAQFLISTEAGGEGINLQKNCHIMVNYDLPWNPMRLVQRIGRLYRYGQKYPVIVFNLKSTDSLDALVVDTMYQRIQQVVADMMPIGSEFRPGLEDEILGDVVNLLDLEPILQDAHHVGVIRTKSRIDEALLRARESAELHRSLFENVARYDVSESFSELRLSLAHVEAFVLGMCKHLGIELVSGSSSRGVYLLRLPDDIKSQIGYGRGMLKLTFDRDRLSADSHVEMVDAESKFFKYLVNYAMSPSFSGFVSGVSGLGCHSIFGAMLRWQNDAGVRLREEYVAVAVNDDGLVQINPEVWRDWLLEPAVDLVAAHDAQASKKSLSILRNALDERLADGSSVDLHPEGIQLISASVVAGLG